MININIYIQKNPWESIMSKEISEQMRKYKVIGLF
jgi:hypothetical protein